MSTSGWLGVEGDEWMKKVVILRPKHAANTMHGSTDLYFVNRSRNKIDIPAISLSSRRRSSRAPADQVSARPEQPLSRSRRSRPTGPAGSRAGDVRKLSRSYLFSLDGLIGRTPLSRPRFNPDSHGRVPRLGGRERLAPRLWRFSRLQVPEVGPGEL